MLQDRVDTCLLFIIMWSGSETQVVIHKKYSILDRINSGIL